VKKNKSKSVRSKELVAIQLCYREAYKKKHGMYPQWLAQNWVEAKKIKEWCEENGQEYRHLVESYFLFPDEFNEKNRHPLSTLAKAPQKYVISKPTQTGPRKMVR
jgi:ubiquinone/menaquinone biosynthesis C-methylase UbiE